MRLLVIGGTHFVGRAMVEDAVGRGHDVTVFHRGPAEPDGFPDVEHVHGDRDGGLEPLRGRAWDAAVDTCGYVPRVVGDSARLLSDAAGHLAFISTLSVYPDDAPAGCNEESPTHQPPFPDTEEITDESYGPLKVACELEALDAFPGRCLVVRPGYIVGPHDPSDRFTFWVRRAAGGRTDAGARTPGPAAPGRGRSRPGRVHAGPRGGRYGRRLRRRRAAGAAHVERRVWRRWWTSPGPRPS